MKRNRLLAFLLCLCMAFSLLPGSALAEDATATLAAGEAGRVFSALKDSPYTFAGGSGTKADPYLVSTADQLNAIRKGLDKHYKLTNDIDLSNWGDWLPIGDEVLDKHGEPTVPFSGSLDGAGHVISGMKIVGTRADFQPAGQREGHTTRFFGLFAYVNSSNTDIKPGDAYEDTSLGGVYNLGVVNYTINIISSNTDINDHRIGAVAGVTKNTRIVGCWSSGGTAEATDDWIGGLVGDATNTAIRECWNSSSITGENVGGIACHNSNVWISHCFNTGTLKGSSTRGMVNGIGYGWYSDGEGKESVNGIMYCYNAGNLSGNIVAGIGAADFLDNIYNAGDLTGESINPIAVGSPSLGITHNGERYLKDENWMDSPTLGRKVLVALREDELISGSTAAGVGSFTDVQPTDYFAEPVIWAVDRRITLGTSNTTFTPLKTCTKAEALTFLYRAEREPRVDEPWQEDIRNTFEATNGEWFTAYYYYASCFAYNLNMITPTTYLHDPCTRADFVTYLWMAAGSPRAQASSQFTDVPAGAAYAQAVAWAVQNGVTSGTSATTFSPNDTCTRSQIVTFLYRVYKNQ